MPTKLEFSPLRTQVCSQATKFFAEVRRQAPQETLYGLAFCVDSDVQSFYCQANSEEALGHPGDRFFINDWKYNDNQATDANRALANIWNVFDKSGASRNLYGEVRKRCLNTIVKGLLEFRQSGALPASIREDFALFVYDPDPGDPAETKELARMLNSQKTYEAFIHPDNGFLYA